MKTNKLSIALLRYSQILLLLISFFAFGIGQVNADNIQLFFSLGVLFAASMLYGIEKVRERFILLLFNFACIFFLFGRTFIKILDYEDWQGIYSDEVHRTTITMIYISVLSLFCGAIIFNQFHREKKEVLAPAIRQRVWESEEFIKNLQIISFILYIVLAFFMLLVEIEKPIKLKGAEYTEYYYAYESSLPGFVLSLSALAKFALCMFLATMPSKVLGFIALGIYVVSTIPVFIVGQRNPFVSAALFTVCYYLLRDYLIIKGTKKKKKWFGKFEGTAIAIALPFMFAFLSIYESIRLGLEIKNIKLFHSISRLFYTQGVTYEVICKCIDYKSQLPITNYNYTFGALWKYIRENAIGRLLGLESYGAQTVESALYGNTLSDTISYLDLGDQYLKGAGWGSSFIVEIFIDYGYIGVAILSFLLGAFLMWMTRNFGKSYLKSYCILLMLIQLFMLPRATATGWLVLLIYIPAIVLIACVFIITYFSQKKYYKDKRG